MINSIKRETQNKFSKNTVLSYDNHIGGSRKSFSKRTVSMVMAIVFTMNAVLFDIPTGFSELFGKKTAIVTNAYTTNKDPASFSNYLKVNGDNIDDLYAYCYHYSQNTDGFAEDHQNDTIYIDNVHTFSGDFMGIGNVDYPFKGKIELSGSEFYVLDCQMSFFTYVYDSVTIKGYGIDTDLEVQFTRSGTGTTPLLADHVSHDTRSDDETSGITAATWKVQAVSGSNAYGGVIGELGENAKIALQFTNNADSEIKSDSDVGVLCGKMCKDSTLNAAYTESNTSLTITSTGGCAGGFVGTMESGASLVPSSIPNIEKNITAATYAGGVVGDMTSLATVDTSALGGSRLTVNGTIKGDTAGGGLYGRYVNNQSETSEVVTDPQTNEETTVVISPTLDIKNYDVDVTVNGGFAGGLFGVFQNGADEEDATERLTEKYVITNTDNNTFKSKSTEDSGYFGGVIGKYISTDIEDSLELNNITINAENSAAKTAFGGAVGFIDGASYLKGNDITIAAKGTGKCTFGGFVAATSSDKAAFVDLGNFTLTNNSESFTGGGVIGRFNKGVLRLSGNTDMSAAKTGGRYHDYTGKDNNGKTAENNDALKQMSYGQIVGYNNDTLVYALGDGNAPTEGTSVSYGSGWQFIRSNGSVADDIGTWGEVVRISNVEDTVSSTDSIITFDSTSHKVTIAEANTTLSSNRDLVRCALNIQLNNGTDYNGVMEFTGSNDRTALLNSTIELGGNVSFSGTGITGFMRDNMADTLAAGNAGSVGKFTGTFDGNGNTITLATGESYGVYAAGQEGSGQIYRHRLNGIFSVIGNGSTAAIIKDLTIKGTQVVRNAGADGMCIGGIAARASGGVTINGVTTATGNADEDKHIIAYYEGADAPYSEDFGKNIGGLIGYIGTDSTDGTIRFMGSNAINTTFNMSGYKRNWLVVGSAIGKIVSSDFTINVGDSNEASYILTDSHKMIANYDSDKIGENADGGGLIGYIAAKGTYTDREINIYNLVFDGAQVANSATKRGGGLLGYAWLDTNTTIKGLIVTSAAIENSTAPDVGVMCYDASGKWTIHSLTVNGLTMSTGAADSIGMIVNKAYDDSTKDNTHGLYIDLLNSGYKLTDSGIDLSTTAKFDEIAAYTASTADNVVKGGGDTGIISVNMNVTNETKTKISETGTYQNRLSSVGSTKYPNSTARYYYNLDKMDVTDPTEKAILWSVRQYAAGNLKGIISVNDITEPFSYEKAEPEEGEGSAEEQANTKINFTGYAYYPVYNVSNVALKNVDITFDYASVPTAAEAVFYAPSVTDDYVRDPKNNGEGVNSRNQHFLMQSGLFINNAEKSTLSLDNVNLSGNFLEVGDYKGVLISGTSYGSIDIDGLVLDGIKPMENAADINANGYLLVNNVKRNSTTSGAIGLNLWNISTSDKYTSGDATQRITKSLFGAVNGPAIGIDVQKVKLDARIISTLPDNTALYTAYGTVNSIFTEATLFASIRTTQASQMIYNYTEDEDWGEGGSGGKRWVTYGKEVKDSKEYVDENGISRENKYYESSIYTDPTTYSPEEAYNFSSGWLPYVGHEYDKTDVDTNGCYWRELKVNVGATDLGEGCGTYNDPYAITKGEKLAAFANFMYYGNDPNARALGQFRLPKDSEKYDTIEENTSGVRWCSDDDAIYSWNGSKFTSSEEGAKEWSSDNVRQYLENAYFQIQNDITLDSFIGFGDDDSNDTTGVYAFRGVIVGGTKTDGSLITITNKSTNPLINISNGCVVKNLNIIQANNITLTQVKDAYNTSANAFGYNSGCTYYGGIIGEVMGGDNIIDNTYITFAYKEKVESIDEGTGAVTTTDVDRNSTVTLSGENSFLLIPVGSYVGVIVFGGVIFKNMDADTVNDNAKTLLVNSGDNTDLAKADKKGAIYANPLIGRVINGYAVNETVTDEQKGTTGRFSVTEDGKYHDGKSRTGLKHSLNNTSKHYPIADINADLNSDDKNKLDVTKIPTGTDEAQDGEINVPNAQALFILSLITQSTSGTATEGGGDYVNSLSYGTYVSSNKTNVYGMSHIAAYDNVGIGKIADPAGVADYNDLAKLDTAKKTAVPYIIRHYTTKKEARTIQVPKHSLSTEYTVESSKYTGVNASLDNGTGFVLYSTGSNKTYYFTDTVIDTNPYKIKNTQNISEAKVWFFENITENKYYIYTITGDNKVMYMVMRKKSNDNDLYTSENKADATVF